MKCVHIMKCRAIEVARHFIWIGPVKNVKFFTDRFGSVGLRASVSDAASSIIVINNLFQFFRWYTDGLARELRYIIAFHEQEVLFRIFLRQKKCLVGNSVLVEVGYVYACIGTVVAP